jgi:CRISPR-associated protein Csb2
MLQLQLRFPSGRYCAASIADPRRPEWPPHPSRVFSALVAAAYAGGHTPTPLERELLQRLEAAAPPVLDFPDHDDTPAPDVFVPVNDVKSRVTDKKGSSGGVLLPNRQVRQFPSVFLLGDPVVTLTWALALDDAELATLDAIAARVSYVGTSHSLAVARFVSPETEPAPRWQPDPAGEHHLRVTLPGRLDELDRLVAERAGPSTLRRPVPLCETMAAYAEARPVRDLVASRYDWITLRLQDVSWGADTAHTLARAVRRAVLSLLGDDAPPAVHAHDPDIAHLAWLPLTDVGHVHAAGRVRGIAVAVPTELSTVDRALTLAGLARLRQVSLPDGQIASVSASLPGPETPIVLRDSTWRAASTHWSTVTPVLLDRPPKRGARDDGMALLDAMAESLVLAGFPAPVDLRVMQTSDFEGAPTARDVPTQVPRFHARVVFARPVQGPVIAGRWKNFGIGLLRPTPLELRTS